MQVERVVAKYGDSFVIAEKLTDGSEVFNVRVPLEEGGAQVILACDSEDGAREVASWIDATVVGVSVKQPVPA